MLELVKFPLLLQFLLVAGTIIYILFRVIGDIEIYIDPGDECHSMRLFLEGSVIDPPCSNCVEVDSDRSNLHLTQVERLGQFFYFTILGEETTSIKIISISNHTF